jgi:hypothetical protein
VNGYFAQEYRVAMGLSPVCIRRKMGALVATVAGSGTSTGADWNREFQCCEYLMSSNAPRCSVVFRLRVWWGCWFWDYIICGQELSFFFSFVYRKWIKEGKMPEKERRERGGGVQKI